MAFYELSLTDSQLSNVVLHAHQALRRLHPYLGPLSIKSILDFVDPGGSSGENPYAMDKLFRGSRTPNYISSITRIPLAGRADRIYSPTSAEQGLSRAPGRDRGIRVENKLQSPDDGRIIVPDAKLKSLLNIEDDVILNYFNMQRYINPHFTVIKGQHQQPADKPVAVPKSYGAL
eukprot:gene29892-17969_t